MPAEPSTLTRLARLRKELAKDRGALEERVEESRKVAAEWRRRGTTGRPELVLLAVNLHAYYTALETLLERIAALLDDERPTGAAWHIELLEQMLVEVPGLRPAILPESVAQDLQELRKFRHFFRNAYTLSLDQSKVWEHVERLLRIHPDLHTSLCEFQEYLEQLLETMSKAP